MTIPDGESVTTLTSDECTTLGANLLLNAIQHSGHSTEIQIVVTDGGFLVRDHGEGIAAESLPFVFNRFYREDKSRARNTGGAGLGLAICKAIVEKHGGKISIDSEVGNGTTVTVAIPVYRVEPADASIENYA